MRRVNWRVKGSGYKRGRELRRVEVCQKMPENVQRMSKLSDTMLIKVQQLAVRHSQPESGT